MHILLHDKTTSPSALKGSWFNFKKVIMRWGGQFCQLENIFKRIAYDTALSLIVVVFLKAGAKMSKIDMTQEAATCCSHTQASG